jgi:hypothetical protein
LFDEPKESVTPNEPTIISGVVHPHGSGGVARKGEGWTLRFAFDTWRGEDGILHRDNLTVSQQVTQDELRDYMKQIQPYGIISARVVFTGAASVELLELLDQSLKTDDALVQRAAELLKPKTFEDKLFGTFTLDRRVDWYGATVIWAGSEIRLTLSAIENAEIGAALRVASKLWQDQPVWTQSIGEYVVQDLLQLKNDVWLDDDEVELTSEDFKARMSLETIGVYPDERFEFWFRDGDLFFGHSIVVCGNLSDGPTRVDIAG